jgi:prevent-host-death family protein
MNIISVSEAKRQIKDLVEQASQGGQVYYITRYSKPKAVVLSAEYYEGLLARVQQLEGELLRIWAAVEAEAVEAVPSPGEPILLPTSDGDRRAFHPSKAASPAVRAALQRAVRLAWQQRDWTTERIAQAGRQAIERARQDAIACSRAIDDEREAALDD